ncbi:DUF433 domain-containing protein [Flavobacteriaceae bacterium 14752]|uniref:DUF433 domain-containing protein n=1 Tax=Mesohalobacter salilacus TaxID=2491711 RepID=UPI000F634D6D|nr:DUF433 domain-containing protein [Flavobacteriaceae bacterium 14752]
MKWKSHIEVNDNVLVGKPVIKGTRISVEHIVNLLASGWSENQILENYPRLKKEDIQSVFAYLQDIIKDGMLYNEPQKYA